MGVQPFSCQKKNDFGPEKLPGLSRNGPQGLKRMMMMMMMTNIWVWVSRWGIKTLTLFRTKKNPKIHALFGTTLEVKVIALYTWTTNKTHLANHVNPYRQYPVDRLTRSCIPCLGQIHTRLYTLFRTERSKTILCPEAHPRIGYIMKYPRGRVCGIKQSRPEDIIGLEGVSSRFRTSSE